MSAQTVPASAADQPRAFSGWTRERFGPWLGLSGQQAALVTAAAVPLLLAMSQARWVLLASLAPVSVVIVAAAVIPVHGRPAYRWLIDLCWYVLGRVTGWSGWRAGVMTAGASTAGEDVAEPDLPGLLASMQFRDGPPWGAFQRQVCVMSDPHGGSWSAVARIQHPGLGTSGADEQTGLAQGLGLMMASAAQSRQIKRISVYVRTVPSDGAARSAWVTEHLDPAAPSLIEEAGRLLEASMTVASVRHELFVAVTLDEARIRKQASDAGRGVTGRARVLYRNMETVERSLRDIGATDVEWLSTEQVAEVVRTGYSPADLAPFEHARQAAMRNPAVATGVPLAAAGPMTAPPSSPRRYRHDSYTSVSYALLLPERNTYVGALARLLAPSEAGERRCIALHYEPLDSDRARRRVQSSSWAMEIADEAKRSKGFRVDRRHQRRMADVAAHEDQLANGHTMVRIAGAAAVTVPAEWPVEDYAARFEADGRACGYVPVRADLAQDSAFAAAVLPLGVGMPNRSDR